MTNESAVRGPWYRYFREEVGKATGFITTVTGLSQVIPSETYMTFEKETLAAFIFESNNLEREGLSLGETRELIFSELDEFSQIGAQTSSHMNFIDLFGAGLEIDRDAMRHLVAEQKRIDGIRASGEIDFVNIHIAYRNRSKEVRTVLQHLNAASVAYAQVLYRRMDDANVSLYWLQKQDRLFERCIDECSTDKNLNLPIIKPLLDEDFVKVLHKTMAKRLIKNALAPAGEYRSHPVSTDMESHYPAPSDVPKAMKKFIEQFQSMEQEHVNPIVLAAWASTQFVLIHPFSDFNGRMSRLIANMVLRANGVPFWTALRSTKKERSRYITALRHYRRDSRRSIATLIAKQVNYNFEEFNKILSLSGYEPIVPSAEFSDLPAEVLETTEFLPHSVRAKQEYEAAVAKSQQ